MKCAKHPRSDALAVCPSCGRAICEICRVNVGNVPHCKECVEWIILQMGRFPQRPMRMPMLRGVPRREFFMAGFVGALIMMIAAAGNWFVLFGGDLSYNPYLWTFIIMNVLFSVSLAITSVGFYGFYRNYGVILGLMSFVFLMIASIIFLGLSIFSVGEPSMDPYEDYSLIKPEFFIPAVILVGVSIVLMGVTLILVEDYTMLRDLSKATGFYNIMIASLFIIPFFTVDGGFGWLALVIGCILMAMVFFKAKLPPRYAGYPRRRMPEISIKPGGIQ